MCTYFCYVLGPAFWPADAIREVLIVFGYYKSKLYTEMVPFGQKKNLFKDCDHVKTTQTF